MPERCVPWEHPGTLVPKIAAPFGPFSSLLDVGGGYGGIVGESEWRIPRRHIHVLDVFPPKHPPQNFRLGDGLEAHVIYGPKSFDVVQCCEVIEHLPKACGGALLAALETVARRLVILTTPRGFTEQDPALAPHEPWTDNPHQKHLCGYMPGEFEALGYQVLVNGLDAQGGPVGGQIVAWKAMTAS